jgi:outer membrane protein assembly factor BamA
LRTLELGGKIPEKFGAVFIEDAALILASRVKQDGYLHPSITISLRLAGGGELLLKDDDVLNHPLPRDLQATAVTFVVDRGLLYYFNQIRFEGMQTLTEAQALPYFVETIGLIDLKSKRVFTPERLRRGLMSIRELLERRGFEQATTTASRQKVDDSSGAVDVTIQVREGSRSIVRSVREEVKYAGETATTPGRTFTPDKPFSRFWAQDFILELKNRYYEQGYPDVSVQLSRQHAETNANGVLVDLLANVETGNRTHIGEVVFRGQKHARLWFMSRRVRAERGDLLNPIVVEDGRYRLSQLGVFGRVDVSYTNVDGQTRNVIYTVEEGKRREVNLLIGWGSYELLRGGVILDEYNIWGLAHHARLKAVQSIKASSGELTYTVPNVRGKDVDLFVYGSGLRREEISFTRLEYGGGIGAQTYYKPLFLEANVRYSYQILDAQSIVPTVAEEGLTNPAVGSISMDLKHDRRDNPLYPHHGYKVFLNLQTASSALGGDANYQRIETWASWHQPVGEGRYLHLGISHGVAISFGDPAHNLPFNERFFPGGANSIRGYQEGEASPRNEEKKIVGAESYVLGNVELEQALTPKWSLVVFADGLGIARSMDDYPWDESLFSVGGGLRWRTMIGPVRLEYGYNLNPRPRDPRGTLQFSLGFPF